jgi:hypothetical protein
MPYMESLLPLGTVASCCGAGASSMLPPALPPRAILPLAHWTDARRLCLPFGIELAPPSLRTVPYTSCDRGTQGQFSK